MPDSFTGQLRWHLKHCGKSMYRLERNTGVHNSQLTRFLRGERGLSLDAIDKIAKHLGLRVIREHP